MQVELMNYAVEVIFSALLLYGGWFGRWLLRTKESRTALHTALSTGLQLATGKIFERVLNTQSEVEVDDLIEVLVDYVEQSVPDALAFLRPSKSHLREMAASYIVPEITAARLKLHDNF